MKKCSLILFSFLSTSLMASVGPFTYKKYDFCKDQVTSRSGRAIYCKGAFQYEEVIRARKVVKASIPFTTLAATDSEYGYEIFPDADTNHIYNFQNALLNSKGDVIGYLDIDGYTNDESGDKAQINSLYNTLGELVSATLK